MEIFEIQARMQEICDAQTQTNKMAVSGHRDLTADEQRTWDILNVEFDYLVKERSEKRRSRPAYSPPIKPTPEIDGIESRKIDTQKGSKMKNSQEYRDLGAYFKNGEVTRENRTLQKDLDSKGGFVITSQITNDQIFYDLDNLVHIRKYATRFVVDRSDSIGIPIMAQDVDDLDFVGEISEASLDTQMRFERRALTPRRVTKAEKVSRDLLSLSEINFGNFIMERLTFKLGTTLENAFLNGIGTNGPEGIFQGVSASRNVSAGNTTTAISADGLINCMFNLKSQYLASDRCFWILHRDVLKMIRKLKDGEGNYLWQPGLGQGVQSSILGKPYLLSEYAPSTFASGSRVAVIGDLRHYGVAERGDFSIQVLLEKFALENCNGYLITHHCDGGVLIDNAFSVATLA